MSTPDVREAPPSRPNRVVSLPCGHLVYVDDRASLLAVSGPVMDHQSICTVQRPPTFVAWFTTGRGPRKPVEGHADRPHKSAPLLVEARSA
jgi:hypothetical protein